MTLSFAVVGPGRMGAAVARLGLDAGARFAGFIGRDPASVERGLAFVGAGRALQPEDLAEVHIVLLTVGDDALRVCVDELRGVPGSGRLWLHTSGPHDLEVLQPFVRRGERVGSVHPLCPVPDAEAGWRDMPGKVAVVQAGPRARQMVPNFVVRLGMRPVVVDAGVDRIAYHAGCAMAANGLTALVDLVERGFASSCALSIDDARPLALGLMRAALDRIEAAAGPGNALSGPVQRGDAVTIARHIEALARNQPLAPSVYRALMGHAVVVARRSGALSEEQVARLRWHLRDV